MFLFSHATHPLVKKTGSWPFLRPMSLIAISINWFHYFRYNSIIEKFKENWWPSRFNYEQFLFLTLSVLLFACWWFCYNEIGCLLSGIRTFYTSLWLQGNPTHPRALYTGTNQPHLGGIAPTHRAVDPGSVRQLRHPACPG